MKRKIYILWLGICITVSFTFHFLTRVFFLLFVKPLLKILQFCRSQNMCIAFLTFCKSIQNGFSSQFKTLLIFYFADAF